MSEDLVEEYRKKEAKSIDEFRVNLGEFAEKAQLNMADNWKEITNDLWKNGRNCTCRVGDHPCPCPEGIAEAQAGGDCFCRLFYGHN